MKLTYFKCKFLKPCKKLVRLFKFKLRRPLFIRSLRFGHRKRNLWKGALEGSCSIIRPCFHLPREGVMGPTSFSDTLSHVKAPHPSPITPTSYVRTSGATKNDQVLEQDEVEDACRSFNKYLKEMIIEEWKMRDLGDVEELLYHWNNLNSPVFIDLVCRFYRELCKDLFSDTSENDGINPREF